MERCGEALTGRATEITIRDLMARLEAGENPRRTMRRLDARIVECQWAGLDVPASFLRLSRILAAEYIARRQADRTDN